MEAEMEAVEFCIVQPSSGSIWVASFTRDQTKNDDMNMKH